MRMATCAAVGCAGRQVNPASALARRQLPLRLVTQAAWPVPAVQNRVIELTVGTGSTAKQYQFAVDTGSSLLEIACQSAAAQANCGGAALSGSYVLTAANTLSSTASCSATGIDCYVVGAGGQPGVCFFSQGVRCLGRLLQDGAWHGDWAGLRGAPAQHSVVLGAVPMAPRLLPFRLLTEPIWCFPLPPAAADRRHRLQRPPRRVCSGPGHCRGRQRQCLRHARPAQCHGGLRPVHLVLWRIRQGLHR